jgi:hypothetical protein
LRVHRLAIRQAVGELQEAPTRQAQQGDHLLRADLLREIISAADVQRDQPTQELGRAPGVRLGAGLGRLGEDPLDLGPAALGFRPPPEEEHAEESALQGQHQRDGQGGDGRAAASKLVIQTQPSTTATAGQAFKVQPLLYLKDANGNLETGDNTTQVTVSLASGAGTLLGTTTVTVKGGIATFTDLYDKAAGPITLGFSASDGLTAGPSTSILISPDVASQLVITTQPSATATAGQVFTTQPVVAEEDKYGNIETGDSSTVVTVSLASGTGPIKGTTSVTLKNGVATFTDLLDKTAETITLQFSGGGLTSAASSPIVVGAGAATGLVIQTQPYAAVTAGNPLTDPIVVAEVDQYGNVVKSDNSTQVTASLASGSGTLKGTTTVTMQNGIASFDNLEDDKAGTLTLQFTAGTLPPVVSNSSTVSPGPAASLGIVVNRPPGGIPAGAKFTATVTAVDAYNKEATSFSGPVTVSLASGSAGTLNGTLTQTASAGVATFNDLSDTTSGSITLAASSGSLTSTPSPTSTATLNPDVPARLIIQAQPQQTATAGTAFVDTTHKVVVYEEDQYGNIETGDSTTVVTAFLGSGSGPLQGTLTATVAGGVATFTNLSDNVAGTITLQFTGNGLTSAASVPIVIGPAAASQLSISQQPSATATAGAAFATQPVVSEKDQYGNLVTTDNSTQVTAALASGAGPLRGTTAVTMKGGIATFTDLSDDTAETITLKFSGGGLTAGPSVPIVVSPAAAASLVIQAQPSQTATAGTPFKSTPVIDEQDRYGNLVTGDNRTTVTAFLASGTGALGGTTSVTLKGGVAAFPALAEDTVGTFTLAFTGGGLNSPASVPVTVGPGAPAKLAVQTPASPGATAGQSFATQPVVYEEDTYGNLVTGDNTTIVTAQLGGAGQLAGTKSVAVKGGIATFTNLAPQTAGAIPLVFTAGSLTSASTNPITISPAAATQLAIHQQPSPTAAVGQPFPTQPVVYVEDQYGNLVTGDNATVVTARLASGAGPLQGTLSVTVKGGVAAFTDLVDPTVENASLAFSAGGLTPASTNPIAVSRIIPHLVIGQQPSATATAGQAFATQPVIYEEDQNGNMITSDNSTVVTVRLGSGSGPLQGTQSVTMKGGVATFTDLVDSIAETITLDFVAGSLPAVASNAIVVNQPTVINQKPTPTITLEHVLTARAKGKKGKPVLVGFELDFSTGMNAVTAEAAGNYTIGAVPAKHGKKKSAPTLTPVPFRASYDPVKHAVTLTLAGKQAFAKGGQITVSYGAITSDQGVALDSSDARFTILPKATGVTLG